MRMESNYISQSSHVQNIAESKYKSSPAQSNDFKALMDKLTGGKMAEEIREKYNVTLNIGDEYNYQHILENNDIRCVNFVQISSETLKKMEQDPVLKKKVMDEIADFGSPEMIAETKALSPPVKSSGLIIYPDGSSSAWVEGYSCDLKDNHASSIFDYIFSNNNLMMKAGSVNVQKELYDRNDFPIWQYFDEKNSADSLNEWNPKEPDCSQADRKVQSGFSKIGFGEMVILIPEKLQQKMDADSSYAEKIAEKVKTWKKNYDTMDNAIAASLGEDVSLYQMTKSYCIELDENGEVKNYTVISGGMDTRETKEEKSVTSRKEGIRDVKKIVKSFEQTIQNQNNTFVESDFLQSGYPIMCFPERRWRYVNRNSHKL